MKNIIYIFSLCLFFTSCIVNKNTRLLQDESYVPTYDSVAYHEYKLKVNDELKLRVISINKEIEKAFNLGQNTQTRNSNSTYTISYRIYPDGTMDVPFTESVYVVGLTVREAEKAIEKSLKDVADDITVKLELSNNYFYLMGRSGKGQYPIYKEKLTIYQAIAQGNFSPGVGNLKKVKIIRQQANNEPVVVTFDLRSNSVINSEYYYVQPNDVIYIETIKGNFFKLGSFTSLTALISSSLTFLLLMLSL